MVDEKNVKREIKNSLEDSKRELTAYKDFLTQKAKRVPASSLHLEKRLESIEGEIETVTPKLLAYKLKRLAGSKSLQNISKKKTIIVAEKVEPFESNTFKCKSDLEKCLKQHTSPLIKALCFGLFIRCVVKG